MDRRGGGREGEGAEEARGGDELDGEARAEHLEVAGEAEEGRDVWPCARKGKSTTCGLLASNFSSCSPGLVVLCGAGQRDVGGGRRRASDPS